MPEEAIGVEGGAEAVRIRGALPRKRRINLAHVTRKRVPWRRVLLAALGAAVACTAFVRCAVLGRFQALRDAEEKLASVQEQFDAAEEILNGYYDARDTYVHVTWSDMTPEEIGMVDPSEVISLLERVVLPVSPLDGWEISDNSISLTVTTPTLEDANALVQRIREEPMVQYCSLRNGGRSAPDAGGGSSVNSAIVICFHSADNSKIRSAGAKGG